MYDALPSGGEVSPPREIGRQAAARALGSMLEFALSGSSLEDSVLAESGLEIEAMADCVLRQLRSIHHLQEVQ